MFFMFFFCVSVSDASGKYSSQFHFGNGFWLGSRLLCRELNATTTKRKSYHGHFALNDSLPFPVKFYVARMSIEFPDDVKNSVSICDYARGIYTLSDTSFLIDISDFRDVNLTINIFLTIRKKFSLFFKQCIYSSEMFMLNTIIN